MRSDDLRRHRLLAAGRAGLVFMLVMVLGSPRALSANSPCLTVKAATEVDGERVRLADIAVLTHVSSEQKKRWGAIVVARAPRPGQARFVGIEAIRIRLKRAGVDPATMTFKGAEDVRIHRRAAALPLHRIAQAVEAAIRDRMPWENEDVIISNIRMDETLPLPTGKLTYRIQFRANEDFLGLTMLSLHLFVDGEPVRMMRASATISVMADVVMAKAPLGKHQHIKMADLVIERRDLAHLANDVIRRPQDALGNRTLRMIYPGTVLESNMIASPPLVKRGDIVKIVATSGSMTITATGMAKQQGRKGDLVRVMNTNSKRVIMAQVAGPGSVRVKF